MTTDEEQRKQALTRGVVNIWSNWAIALAVPVAVIMLAPVVPKSVMPAVCYVMALLLFVWIRNNRKIDTPACLKIPYVIALTMFWVGTLFLIFELLKVIHAQYGLNGQPYNPSMPYIAVLVMAPVGITVAAYFIRKGSRCAYCRDCEARSGQLSERGFMGKIYTQESDFQERMLLGMWCFLTVVAWGYYFVFYININLNSSDRFFYIWMPTAVYVLSLIYMGVRYYSFWMYYSAHDPVNANDILGFSRLRFLVICGNRMLINIPDATTDPADIEDVLADTPAKMTISFRTSLNKIEAYEIFARHSGIRKADVRPLYVSSDRSNVTNILHFAAYLDSTDDAAGSHLTGKWLTLGEIQMIHDLHLTSPLLEAELDRIHRTVMAWKTYTLDGKRLYAIKHYRPTFRLSDMRSWDVDYNDSRWLFVEMNNEDRPFFRLRRLWRRLITGTGV